ncbi:MAG: insulinase family protein [Prevotellaceae bacterium]|jgi:predicted Zn-dependent peptidase|nr:insulinase family protein [Prevotellaceae bacterium]
MKSESAYIFHLSSGITCVFSPVSAPVAYCALGVAAGSRLDPFRLNGLAHLTEHMLFKGTQKRSAYHINNRLERLGGELNAYTTKEETVIHATVLKSDLAKALDLLSDIFFHSTFPELELVKEKEVIADEISSYKESPSELIVDEFDQFLFGTHPLATPILGSRSSLALIKRSDLFDFAQRFFVPSQMVLSVVANISERQMQTLALRYFSLPSAPYMAPPLFQGELPAPFFLEKYRRTHQAHCLIGVRAYSIPQPKRIALSLLINMLGGPSPNARLNLLLREKFGLVYNVEASYTPYSDSGVAGIYFGSDKGDLKRCSDLIRAELDKLCQSSISQQQLRSAQKQLIGQLAIAADNAESKCLGQLKSVMVFGKVEPLELLADKIRAVTSQELREISQELFSPQVMSTLLYV